MDRAHLALEEDQRHVEALLLARVGLGEVVERRVMVGAARLHQRLVLAVATVEGVPPMATELRGLCG